MAAERKWWRAASSGLLFVIVANVGVWFWSSQTLQLYPELSVPQFSIPSDVDSRKLALDVVIKEKEFRLSEAAANVENFQTGVIFYLSVVVAGAVTAGLKRDAPDWRKIRTRPSTPFFVLLFLFANVTIAAQGITLSLNALANAKFVHVYLNPQIAALAGWTVEKAPWGKKIHDVLFWDQWWADIKQLFTVVRDGASYAWIGVVGLVNVIPLALFEPRILRRLERAVAMLGLLAITVFVGWLTHALLLYGFLGKHFGSRTVQAPTFHLETATVISLLVLLGWSVIAASRRAVLEPVVVLNQVHACGGTAQQ